MKSGAPLDEDGMGLWVGNVAPGTTQEELMRFLGKYAADLRCTSFQYVEGDGSRPAVALRFPQGNCASVEAIARRLNGVYWKGRRLVVNSTMRW